MTTGRIRTDLRIVCRPTQARDPFICMRALGGDPRTHILLLPSFVTRWREALGAIPNFSIPFLSAGRPEPIDFLDKGRLLPSPGFRINCQTFRH